MLIKKGSVIINFNNVLDCHKHKCRDGNFYIKFYYNFLNSMQEQEYGSLRFSTEQLRDRAFDFIFNTYPHNLILDEDHLC